MMDFRDPQKNQNEKHYKKALAHCNDAPHERMPPTVLFFFFFFHIFHAIPNTIPMIPP